MAHRRFAVVGAAVVLAACCLGAWAAETPVSGPQVGEGTPSFNVQDVTGLAKGGKICYTWRYGGRPTLVVFGRALDDHLTGLVKAVDKFVADNKDKRAVSYVVLLDENNEANQAKLADLAKKEELSVPLTLSLDGATGPAAYKLNADVPITVLVVKRNKVEANFALAAAADEEARKKEISEILAAAAKLLE